MTTEDISPKQCKALEIMLTTGVVTEAAQAAEVTRETVYAWMKTSRPFRQAMEQAASVSLNQLATHMDQLAFQALTTLNQILIDPNTPVSARIKAADIVISRQIQLQEITNINRRITLLEEVRY